ncbi:MAG: dynamin family protein [Methylococcales bacterium]|nr:dynamin family protein [Methylococcales bacterium]
MNDESLVTNNGYSQKIFQVLRERANSELLSIAFFGAFSSGKSFLISGLSNRIDFYKKDGREQFTSMLPASPRHTSSCPVAIEPLPLNYKDDVFHVSFEGSDEWEQKSPAKLAIIKTYVTDLPDAVANRLTNKDRTRIVVKAKIGIASAPLKARLYDLPGFGAIGVNYEKVIHNFVQQADCIVYVAWAIRPLEEKDLVLLRDIYNHHKTTGKPIFFVLTQIDLAWEIDSASGKVKWEDVLDANNEFLSTHFTTSSGRPDGTFIGGGFTPVSPAFEAKGISLAVQNPADSNELILDGRMKNLRDRFIEYLQSTSGPMHLAELASEVQRLLTRLTQDIHAREISESTPREEAQQTIKAYKAQRSTLIQGKQIVKEELVNLGNSAIKRAFAGSDPNDLSRLLTERLQAKINSGDMLNEGTIHEIETEKASIVREWVSRNSKALIPRWVGAWESFIQQSNVCIDNLLEQAQSAHDEAIKEDEETEADIMAAEVEKRVGKKPRDENQKEQTLKDTIEVMATTWKTWTFVAGLGATGIVSSAAAAASTPILAALGPIGWGILATAGVGALYARWKLTQDRNERKEEMLNDLPDYSQRVINSYQVQANEFITTRVDVLLEIVDDDIARLDSSINSLEQRLLTGEYLDRDRRIETLKRLTQQCIEIDHQINNYYKSTADIQPNVNNILNNYQSNISS